MLEIKISKKYQKDIFKDLNLKFVNHQITAIVGESGCGKSTLLNCILNLEKYEGWMKIDNQLISKPSKEFAIIFQDFTQLFPWLNVIENIIFPLRHTKMSKDEKLKEANRLLLLIGLKDYGFYQVNELSGGMKQRVALARALILKPKYLLLDEAFSALDYQNKYQLLNLLDKLNNLYNTTIIFVTHDLQEALYIADRVIQLGSFPSTIVKDITLNLPKPRNLESKEFINLVSELKNDQI